MTPIEQHHEFDLALAAVPACLLTGSGARAQAERYRAIAPFITKVRDEAMTVVVEFADDLGGVALDEVVAVERQCCAGVLDFEFDQGARSLTVTATDPDAHVALELIATGFRQSWAR